MSDLMFFGVLRMPYEMAMSDDLSRLQLWQCAQEAADRVEMAEKRLAELGCATPPSPSTAGLAHDFRKLDGTCGCSFGNCKNGLDAPAQAYATTAPRAVPICTHPPGCTRCNWCGFRAPSTASEDERALFEKAMNDARFFPAELSFTRTKSPSGRDEYANSHLQSCWEGWQACAALAAKSCTQAEGAKDAERFRRAIALEDNAEALYAAVQNNAPDTEAIRAEFDATVAPTQSTKQPEQIEAALASTSLQREHKS